MITLICNNTKPFPVNTIAPDLEIGKEYILKQDYTCECGEIHYNVGLPLEVNYVECYKCREQLPLTTHWCHSSRFNIKEE